MEITYLGHSCFRLKGKEVTLVTDPYEPPEGGHLGRQQVHIVTLSHAHSGHSHAAGVEGHPRVLRGPGEYEVSGVYITGFPSFHDAEEGERSGKNTLYLIEMEGLVLCHLGDLGHPLTPSVVEDLGRLDVLFLPVGGGSTIDGAAAAETVKSLAPRLAIPMHYRNKVGPELEPVDRFLKELGCEGAAPRPRLNVTQASLSEKTPDKTEVVVLEHPLTP